LSKGRSPAIPDISTPPIRAASGIGTREVSRPSSWSKDNAHLLYFD